MEDSPQRRFATQRVRHTNVTENLSVSVGQTCADVEDSPHNDSRLGLGGLKSRGWVGGLGRGGWAGELGRGSWGRGVGNPNPD